MAAIRIGRVRSSQFKYKVALIAIAILVIVELTCFVILHSKQDLKRILRCSDRLIYGFKRKLLGMEIKKGCTTLKKLIEKRENLTNINNTLPNCPSELHNRAVRTQTNCTRIQLCNDKTKNAPHTSNTNCPYTPPNRVGCINIHPYSLPFSELAIILDHLEPGGRYSPSDCVTNQRVAIIIPYRNREEQLQRTLLNLHLFLRTQQIDYGIFVVEQAGQNMFNRGLLMNIGYKEAIEIYNYTCIVFHDVDLIPEDDRIYYGCGKNPRHLSVAIDIYDYKQLENVFGGVTQLPRTIMEKVNGFSNLYFGWGGEDDDLAARIKHVSSTIEINSPSVSRYSMIKHCHENSNPPNPERHALLNAATRRFKYDGLSGLRYKRLHMERNKLYTNITVEFHLDDYRQLLKRSLAHVKKGKRRRFGHSITSPPPLTPRKRDKGV